MSLMASQITSASIVYSTVCSGRDQGKTSKFRVTGFCEGNLPVIGEFRAQKASNAENVTIWWRHHATTAKQTTADNAHSCGIYCWAGMWGEQAYVINAMFMWSGM